MPWYLCSLLVQLQKYILLGLGKPKKDEEKNKPNSTGIKIGTKIASTLINEKNTKKCTVVLPSSLDTSYADIASAFYSALYADTRFKGLKKNAKLPAEDLASVAIHVEDDEDVSGINTGINYGKAMAKGIYLTKDIVNAPHNILNSLGLANVARRLAKESGGRITCQILGKKECETRGMGAFLGVARGSETEPQLIHLTYKPSGGKVK